MFADVSHSHQDYLPVIRLLYLVTSGNYKVSVHIYGSTGQELCHKIPDGIYSSCGNPAVAPTIL